MIKFFLAFAFVTYACAGIALVMGIIPMFNDRADIARSFIEFGLILMFAGITSSGCGLIYMFIRKVYLLTKGRR